ncbi:MAG TPA: GNAT family N-acetyltransferase [Micromonosporaceae bacterium]|nr:GNAT family N-acetyltransferase [Micromonosporaceae bacterium]
MNLPTGWTARRPTLKDVPAILAVVHASDIAAVGYPDFSAEEVREVMTAPNMDPARDSWVVLDADGEMVAWAYLDNPNGGHRDFVEVYVRPDRGEPAQAPLLARQLERVAERVGEFGLARMWARAGAIPTEQRWIGILRDAGFEFVKRYARMRRPLKDLSDVPPVAPPAVHIRLVDPESEADLRSFHRIIDTAFQDTEEHESTTYEQWRKWVDAEQTVPWDECFMAVVDGEPVGALQSSNRGLDDNEGWVRYLAVLREHRHRGIGRALLASAFAVYAGKGRQYAGLGVDLTNPTEAARLYRSVGMTPMYESDNFERAVTAIS